MKKDLNIAEIKKEIKRLELEAQRLRTMAMKDIMGKSKGQPIKKNIGGKIMKAVPADNPGLAKLPTKVRNRMGYKQTGGKVTAGSTGKGSTRGTPSQGARAYEAQIKNKQKFLDDMAKEEAARLKGKGGEIY